MGDTLRSQLPDFFHIGAAEPVTGVIIPVSIGPPTFLIPILDIQKLCPKIQMVRIDTLLDIAPMTDDYPVETVSWFDAIRYSNMLSEKEGLVPFYTVAEPSVQVHDWAGPGYRLPTEAEWEYACRASSQMRYSFGDVGTELLRHAWFSDSSGQVTHPVGQKLANTWGLYDMHGNVWEWCWDWYSAEYYKHSTSVDARGPEQANSRVRRGGSFGDSPADLRSAVRTRLVPMIRSRFVGFRLARTCD